MKTHCRGSLSRMGKKEWDRKPMPRDRFITVKARTGFSDHIASPDLGPLTLCGLSVGEVLDDGIDFADYDRRCKPEHIAPRGYCAPCNRAYLIVHGVHEPRWDRWDAARKRDRERRG